ncbi:NAD(P)/FAD-dependent oxidoreductase [Emcibacter nanhaiensis]|uniref:FAD-binding oxidoreductase n=1 Tax=Emcibacter nanhaiensis TaxID=1505037 RepID=A0A501PH29_9PROT|nr:FAD-binding oxidoreductase [Emcibacter nanhaiensis]TPD59387.1 FAD-binding oxidoreductase [Emcibacter nanhaiensis]
MTETFDFIIIGGGIAGASAAWFLSPHGRTLILEREEYPGYHTTGRSAAFFAETYGNAVVQQLTRASRSFLLSPPDGFSETPLVHKRGAVYMATAEQVEFLEQSYRTKKAVSPEIKQLTATEILEKAPCLRKGYAVAGYEDPGCRDIDVHALHQGYLRGMKKNGGKMLCNQSVEDISRSAEGWQVELAEGRVEGRVLVNAAGAWGDELAAVAGVAPIGLDPRRRTVICVDADGAELSPEMPLVLDAEDEFYFKPEGGGILLTPCDETPMPPCDVQPEELDIARAIDRLEQASEFRVTHVRRKWSGLRTFVPDRSPVVGFDPDIAGFFWCVGQGGFGIQTSPAIGRLVAELIVNGETGSVLPVAEISPQRFRN